MVDVNQLLPGFLQGVNAALVCRELSLKSLMLLYFPLQVGWVLPRKGRRGFYLEPKDIKLHCITLTFIFIGARIKWSDYIK